MGAQNSKVTASTPQNTQYFKPEQMRPDVREAVFDVMSKPDLCQQLFTAYFSKTKGPLPWTVSDFDTFIEFFQTEQRKRCSSSCPRLTVCYAVEDDYEKYAKGAMEQLNQIWKQVNN